MENTDYPYNDDAFMEASNGFQGNLEEGILALWQAGASLKDIESELANGLDNALEGAFKVSILER